jgi:uncharacterized OsmC-like protein
MKINNVNVQRVEQEARAIQADASRATRVIRVEGAWNLDEAKPQFQATARFEGGEATLECDSPTFMGGEGRAPGPLHYCVYGYISCFASTLVTIAAGEGVRLKNLRVTGESEVDFSRVFGVADNPVVKEVRISVAVDADAAADKVQELKELALRRCPAIFCLTNPITVRVEVS